MRKTSDSKTNFLRTVILAIVFLSLTCLLYLGFQEDKQLVTQNQKLLYSLGFGGLLAGLVTLLLAVQTEEHAPAAKSKWFYPGMAGLLGLVCMALAYMYMGVWPVGDRSVMVVDMHHQYAPLLAQLRDMILHGGNGLYSFDIGLGGSFLPLFAYYLSSPFNLLLTLFPEGMLNEGILVITLLKNALTAFSFALCVQYIYRRRDISVVIVSIMYSMMMYLIAYSWDIMWLDCVMILPIVIMNFEKLMRTGKYLPYVLSLAYALYANYYIGFMLCVFLVLYFLCFSLRQVRTFSSRKRFFGRFAVGSLLGGGLVMFLLVPTYLALGQTSAAGGTLPEMKNNFDMFNLLGRHLYETSPTIRSGNLPNIYCGVLSIFLLPIFATLRSIPMRRRVSYIGLLGVMGASLVLNQMDLLWHGLHAPNDLPYRFSFLYSFVLLLIAYETLTHIREIRFRQISGSFLGLLAYLMLEERFGDEAYGFSTIYVSLLLLGLYAVITGLVSRRRLFPRPAYCLLLLVVTAEMVFNGGVSFQAVNSKEYFTARKDYVANDVTEALHTAVNRTEEIGDAASNGAFYRLEFLPRRTTVDTALYDYHGCTVFASSNPQSVTKFMGYLGYAVNGVNSYLYKSFVPTTDSLLGIKYVVLNSDLSSHPQLTKLEQTGTNENPYYIYENTDALPVGFVAASSIKSWQPVQYNPIASQNSLFASLTGNADELFALAATAVDPDSGMNGSTGGGTSFSVNPGDGQQTVRFNAAVAETGQAFVYIDCGAAKSISVSSGSNTWSVSPREPFIIDAGSLSAGDTVTVSVTAESSCTGNIYVATLRKDVYEAKQSVLAESPFVVKEYSDTHLSGTVNAAKSGVLFTSIPYDEGWTVKVDGKKVETFAACDAMLAFDLGAGEHTVELSFFTVGLIPGIILSIVSLILLILLLWFIQKNVNRRDPGDDEFVAFGRLLRHVSAGRTASEMPSPPPAAPGESMRPGSGPVSVPEEGGETPQTPGRIGAGSADGAGGQEPTKDDSEGFDYDTDAGF